LDEVWKSKFDFKVRVIEEELLIVTLDYFLKKYFTLFGVPLVIVGFFETLNWDYFP